MAQGQKIELCVLMMESIPNGVNTFMKLWLLQFSRSPEVISVNSVGPGIFHIKFEDTIIQIPVHGNILCLLKNKCFLPQYFIPHSTNLRVEPWRGHICFQEVTCSLLSIIPWGRKNRLIFNHKWAGCTTYYSLTNIWAQFPGFLWRIALRDS